MLGAAAVVLAGCADAAPAATSDARPGTYPGPLQVDAANGAAGEVVECRTRVTGADTGDEMYDDGAVADNPDGAWATIRSEALMDGATSGYTVARDEGDRVLYTYAVDGVVRQAAILHHGQALGGTGWYLESWARCDLSEFPDAVAEASGVEVWTDESGARVPTTRITSSPGPEHCGWQDMTFLYLAGAAYVREPDPDLADWFAESYDPSRPLPSAAADTGYERDGEQLWLSPDGQRAYVGSRDDVELWPRADRELACA